MLLVSLAVSYCRDWCSFLNVKGKLVFFNLAHILITLAIENIGHSSYELTTSVVEIQRKVNLAKQHWGKQRKTPTAFHIHMILPKLFKTLVWLNINTKSSPLDLQFLLTAKWCNVYIVLPESAFLEQNKNKFEFKE